MKESLTYLNLADLKSDTLTIERGYNLIIDDNESLDRYKWEAMAQLLTPSIIVLNASELTEKLDAKLAQKNKTPIAVGYPTKGGLEVRKRLTSYKDIPKFNILSDRSSPQGYPVVTLPPDLLGILEQRFCKKAEPVIALIDDVIGSGFTLQKIAETMTNSVIDANTETINDDFSYSKFPYQSTDYGLPIYSASAWLLYDRTNRQTSLGKRIESPITYALTYKGLAGKVAVNSISTLLRPGNKENRIREAYASKYSPSPSAFIGLLNEIGGLK